MIGGPDPKTLNWPRLSWGQVSMVTAPRREALLADLEARMTKGTGFALATLNLDHVVKLRTDTPFATAYAAQTHVTADGNPIVWMQRLAGREVELIPGSELVEPVAALAAKTGTPVGLFGASPEALAGATKTLMAQIPGLQITAQIAPPMGFDPSSDAAGALIDELAQSGARVVFLALGAPKQERLAARILQTHPQIGCLSIGATLDFLAGTQTRAPKWARTLAIEWLWRLLQDPGRLWRRYALCFAILPQLTLGALRQRRSQG